MNKAMDQKVQACVYQYKEIYLQHSGAQVISILNYHWAASKALQLSSEDISQAITLASFNSQLFAFY